MTSVKPGGVLDPKGMRSPCNECPFNPKSKLLPNDIGGSPPELYVGQIQGPFFLPCHKSPGYHDVEDKCSLDPENTLHCAGAAIFRANVGVDLDKLMVPGVEHNLLVLPADSEKAFPTFIHFLAYHHQESLTEASVRLVKIGLRALQDWAFNRGLQKGRVYTNENGSGNQSGQSETPAGGEIIEG